MSVKSAIIAYMGYVINADPQLRINRLFQTNTTFFNELGLTNQDIAILNRQFRNRMADWRKYFPERTTDEPYTKLDESLYTLDGEDADVILSIGAPGVYRIPYNEFSIKTIDDAYTLVLPRRNEICELIGLELYQRGEFGCDIFTANQLVSAVNNGDLTFANDQHDEGHMFDENDPTAAVQIIMKIKAECDACDDIHAWLYVKFTGKHLDERKSCVRAY